jgi:signal transduction histidine kinase
METLPNLLDTNAAKLERCFCEAAGGDATRETFAAFMAELLASLRGPANEVGRARAADRADDAPDAARPRVDVVAVTRAFGVLHGRVVELAADVDVELTPADHRALAAVVNGAVARAAVDAAQRHCDEMYRMAHQLRNPLGSALMALTLLRARADLGEHARLADMLERNLKRLQALIDESVGEGAASTAA